MTSTSRGSFLLDSGSCISHSFGSSRGTYCQYFAIFWDGFTLSLLIMLPAWKICHILRLIGGVSLSSPPLETWWNGISSWLSTSGHSAHSKWVNSTLSCGSGHGPRSGFSTRLGGYPSKPFGFPGYGSSSRGGFTSYLSHRTNCHSLTMNLFQVQEFGLDYLLLAE